MALLESACTSRAQWKPTAAGSNTPGHTSRKLPEILLSQLIISLRAFQIAAGQRPLLPQEGTLVPPDTTLRSMLKRCSHPRLFCESSINLCCWIRTGASEGIHLTHREKSSCFVSYRLVSQASVPQQPAVQLTEGKIVEYRFSTAH